MSLSSSGGKALPMRAFFAVYMSIAAGGDAWADRYSFNESNGSWSDAENWQNSDPEGPEGPPGGDDEAVFAINTTVSLDSSVAVGWFDLIQGDTTLALGGHTLGVLNLRQFRVASGGEASLTLTPGAVSSNGLAVGMGGKGTLTVPNGATVSDSDEIDIGYSNEGTLQLSGGLVESKRVFFGGFANAIGTVEISKAATLRANTDYIVVGNLGYGTLKVSDGGKAEAPRVIVGSFASSFGEATITGGSSTLNAQTHLHVGYSGGGKLTIDEGAKATTNDLRVGDIAGSNGELHITGNGSSVDVGLGGAYFGPSGTSYSRIASGGKLNVASGGPVHLGGESTGYGVLNIDGQGSALNAPDSHLEIGKSGVGQLHLSNGASLNVKEITLDAGAGKTSQFTLGSQTSVQLPSFLGIVSRGKATIQITGSSQLSAHDLGLYPASGGEAEVQVTGSSQLSAQELVLNPFPGGKANLTVRDVGSSVTSAEGLKMGLFGGESTITIDQGGKLVTPGASIGLTPDSRDLIVLNGASSKLDSPLIIVAVFGRGVFTLENGASYSTSAELFVGGGETGDGTVNVKDGSRLEVNNTMFLGVQGKGALKIQNHGQATISRDLMINEGHLGIESGGSVTVGGLVRTSALVGSFSNIVLSDGAGSRFNFDRVESGLGISQISIFGGTIMSGKTIESLDVPVGEQTILVGGGRLQADKINLFRTSDNLIVNAGGHVWATSSLSMGRAVLTLDGGSVDVGLVPSPFPEVNFVRVGFGGFFGSSRPVPNLRVFGGMVSVGASPGTLTVTGDYFQEPGGILKFSITGVTPGDQYSQLVVGGNLELSGKLRIAFEDGFAPQPGQTFDLITVAGTAQLANYQIEIGNLAPGFAFDFAPFNGGYRLTALSAGQYVGSQSGDFNADGVVDGYDLTSWEANFGLAGGAANAQGDADGDGDVDGADFLSWQRRIGQSLNASAAAAPVPEPAAWLLLSLALAFVRSFRPNRRFYGAV